MPDDEETAARPRAHRTEPTAGPAEEVLEELKELGDEEDTDTSEGAPGGSGDPISPSPEANRKTAEGRPSDRDA